MDNKTRVIHRHKFYSFPCKKCAVLYGARHRESSGQAPEHLTEKQRAQLTFIAKADKQRYRAYLLKEKLRLVFQCEGTNAAKEELDRWIKWAQHKTATEVFPISSRSN